MKRALIEMCVLAVGACLIVGCGGKDKPKDTGKTDGGKAVAQPTGPLTPTQWTNSMVACYQATVKDTIAALDGTPPAEQALPKMKAVYEKSIEKHVALGKQREAMTPADRTKADNSFSMKLMSLQSSDDFKAYIKLSNDSYSTNKAKSDTEKECAKLVRGINIISQYAQFDLLKKQEPKEAERLGIK